MLTKYEILFLLIMAIAVMGHVVITPLIIDVVGRDGWISILLSLPLAFMLSYSIYRLHSNFPGKDIFKIIYHLLGKFVGNIILAIFLLYFLFLATYSFALFINFVYIAFLPDTPRLAILIWFLIFFIYASTKGIKQIALTAGILAIIAMITGHTITLLDTRLKDWVELQPILEFGWEPVLWGTLILTSIWTELLLILFLSIKNIQEKRMLLFWNVGILLNALMMFSTFTGAVTIFGVGQADNFVYPALESVRIISLGFIDRFDIYGLLLMSAGIYIRCSLYFRIAYNITTHHITFKKVMRIIFTVGILVVSIGAYYLSTDHYKLDQTISIYAYFIILFPIPFLLHAISYFRKKKYFLK